MRESENSTTFAHVFDSLGDMLDAAQRGESSPVGKQSRSNLSALRRKAERGDDWTYGALRDGPRYIRTLTEGWDDAVVQIDALVGKIAPHMAAPLDVRRKLRRGPQGDEFCPHTARAGKFDKAWTARRRTVAQAPAPIRILCNTVFNCTVSAEAFFWKGACALALSQALRRNGYRVAISGVGILIRPFENARKDYVARFDALAFGEAPDTARLAGILCSSATLRHVLFRTALLSPATVSSGYGQAPYDDESVMLRVVQSEIFPPRNEERLLIPQRISRESEAAAWLQEVSAKFA